MRVRAWATALLLVLAGDEFPANAQPLAPTGPPPVTNVGVTLAPAVDARTQATGGYVLGAPVLSAGVLPDSGVVMGLPVNSAGGDAPTSALPPVRSVQLGTPTVAAPIPASLVEKTVRRTTPILTPDPVNEFLFKRVSEKQEGDGKTVRTAPEPSSRESAKFSDTFDGIVNRCKEWFRSDHTFDRFISPVSSPFLFEDPRSLTELRPVFIYEHFPSRQPDFHGGSATYFGVQGRLAITERWSFVLNKLGGIAISPSGNSEYSSHVGFAELWFGPKYTFLRDEQEGRVMAAGLTFQVPVGNASVFQHTGSLSLVPYVSYAQSFLRDLPTGGLNGMLNGGYSYSTNHARSDYLYLNAHIDLDVLNRSRFYPLAELNYSIVTSNGNSLAIGSEGRDLFNFGGQAKGKGLLTGALGMRYKITESAQVGGVFELPFAGPRDLFGYRFMLDFILKY